MSQVSCVCVEPVALSPPDDLSGPGDLDLPPTESRILVNPHPLTRQKGVNSNDEVREEPHRPTRRQPAMICPRRWKRTLGGEARTCWRLLECQRAWQYQIEGFCHVDAIGTELGASSITRERSGALLNQSLRNHNVWLSLSQVRYLHRTEFSRCYGATRLRPRRSSQLSCPRPW
jgi:hypothetical protein